MEYFLDMRADPAISSVKLGRLRRCRVSELLISEGEARSVLAAYHETLERAVRDAYAVWDEVAPKFQKPLKRTRAQVISNAYLDRALATLGTASGIKMVEENERLLLAV